MSVVYYHMWYWDLCHDSTTERGDRQPMVDHYAADIDMFDLIKLAHFSAWALQMILRSVTWLVVTCGWLLQVILISVTWLAVISQRNQLDSCLVYFGPLLTLSSGISLKVKTTSGQQKLYRSLGQKRNARHCRTRSMKI